MVGWTVNADNMKQCDASESNNTCARTKLTKIIYVTTFPDAQASSVVKVKANLIYALELPVPKLQGRPAAMIQMVSSMLIQYVLQLILVVFV